MFQTKDSVRHTSAITAVTQFSMKPWRGITLNCHLRSRGKRNGAHWSTKASFGRTMMQALELLRLAKRHFLGQSDEDQWRNQACSLSHFWVPRVWGCQSDNQSVEILKFHSNLVQRLRVDLKTVLSLAVHNQYSPESKYLAGFWVRF